MRSTIVSAHVLPAIGVDIHMRGAWQAAHGLLVAETRRRERWHLETAPGVTKSPGERPVRVSAASQVVGFW
jgi:hypothetical protein